jgi:hypothetical protein
VSDSLRFFSIDSPKAIKANKYGYVNAINYMAPANTAGAGNLCPHASPGCLALCLGWFSGQAGMLSNAELEHGDNAARDSRARKARAFMHDRGAFMLRMFAGIQACQRKAARLGLKLCVRPNGATDITWESIRFTYGDSQVTIVDLFHDTQFVDYTKNYRRMLRFCEGKLPRNYHLTFSRSETNETECLDVLSKGGNVAVVSSLAMPTEYWGHRVINGDLHDLRHLDAKNVVVWLTPKGRKAKADRSGMVLRSLSS